MRRKVPGLSNNSTLPAEPKSGISEIQLPKVLKYPTVYPLFSGDHLTPQGQSIRGKLCYVIEHYKPDGISALILRSDDNVVIQIGDWNGNNLNLEDETEPKLTIALDFLEKYSVNLCATMNLIKLSQAQFFFTDDLCLVDMQLSLNQFASPGLIRDLLSNIMQTQVIRKIVPLDDQLLQVIRDGTGSYEGDLIIKPSRFQMYDCLESGTSYPLYLNLMR